MNSELPIPGTVHLVDVDHILSGVRHGENEKDIVLVPQPSSDPDDPLNWTPRRKLLSTCCQLAYTFFSGLCSSCLSPAYLLMVEDTGIPLADINTGAGLMFLFMGWSNVIMQPLALNYGRRPVLLYSILATAMICLWSAYVKSTGEWWANRIIMVSWTPGMLALELRQLLFISRLTRL